MTPPWRCRGSARRISAIRMPTASGATNSLKVGLASFSPSTAESTEIAGVITELPRNIEAPITPTMKTKAVRRPSARRGERRERERAALPVIVGAQQDEHVFRRHRDNQRPQDEGEHAENDAAGDAGDCRWQRAPLRGRRRAGWCRYRHRRRRHCQAPARQISEAPHGRPWRPGPRRKPPVRSRRHSLNIFRSANGQKGGPYITAGRGRILVFFRGRMTQIKRRRYPIAAALGLEIGWQRWCFPHQGNGDPAVRRHVRVVGEQRIGVGFAGNHKDVARRHTFGGKNWRTELARSAESSHGP